MSTFKSSDAKAAHHQMSYSRLLLNLYNAAKLTQAVILTGRPEIEGLLAGEWVAIPREAFDKLRAAVDPLMLIAAADSDSSTDSGDAT